MDVGNCAGIKKEPDQSAKSQQKGVQECPYCNGNRCMEDLQRDKAGVNSLKCSRSETVYVYKMFTSSFSQIQNDVHV